MSNGFIYCLSNPSMEGILKIGVTRNDVYDRIEQLSSTTSIPTKFNLEMAQEVQNPFKVEKLIHKKFDWCRVSANREFFRIDVDTVKNAFEEVTNPMHIWDKAYELLANGNIDKDIRWHIEFPKPYNPEGFNKQKALKHISSILDEDEIAFLKNNWNRVFTVIQAVVRFRYDYFEEDNELPSILRTLPDYGAYHNQQMKLINGLIKAVQENTPIILDIGMIHADYDYSLEERDFEWYNPDRGRICFDTTCKIFPNGWVKVLDFKCQEYEDLKNIIVSRKFDGVYENKRRATPATTMSEFIRKT